MSSTLIYRSGKTNQAIDALSQCPEPNCKLESYSDSDDLVVLSYATICNIIEPVLGDSKIPFNIKIEAQTASNLLEGKNNMPKFLCSTLLYGSDQCSLSF